MCFSYFFFVVDTLSLFCYFPFRQERRVYLNISQLEKANKKHFSYDIILLIRAVSLLPIAFTFLGASLFMFSGVFDTLEFIFGFLFLDYASDASIQHIPQLLFFNIYLHDFVLFSFVSFSIFWSFNFIMKTKKAKASVSCFLFQYIFISTGIITSFAHNHFSFDHFIIPFFEPIMKTIYLFFCQIIYIAINATYTLFPFLSDLPSSVFYLGIMCLFLALFLFLFYKVIVMFKKHIKTIFLAFKTSSLMHKKMKKINENSFKDEDIIIPLINNKDKFKKTNSIFEEFKNNKILELIDKNQSLKIKSININTIEND